MPIIYLALTLPSGSSSLPNPDGLPKQSFERAVLNRSLFGLSTRKVYHALDVAIKAVGSYPAFSPFPSPEARVVCFLWHYLFRQLADLPVRKYDALCCPDFPPSASWRSAISRLALVQIYVLKLRMGQ